MKNCLHKFKIFKNGFTLAEVLITLVIVGVVAAFTIPTLINKTEEREFKAALKKNYSILQQVFDKYYIEHGERLSYDVITSTSGTKTFLQKIEKYFSSIKSDTSIAPLSNFSEIYTTYDGKRNLIYGNFNDGMMILNDGTALFFNNDSGGVFILVDVNGYEKKPNRLGKDTFMFEVISNGNLLPIGAEGTQYADMDKYCSNNSTSYYNGAACTNKVLMNK